MNPTKRMIDPAVAFDSDLRPLEKRAVYIALHHLAEDSGCFVANPRAVRKAAVPLEADITDAEVAEYLRQLEDEGFVWGYEAEGVQCGFLPDFPVWNRSLTRWNAPREVPLPPGIGFVPHESKNRYESGTYHWAKTPAALGQAAVIPKSEPSVGTRLGGFRNPDELFKD
ncbi:MAG: hypothetical protein Q7J82_02960 [Coriobacteriia bacterium]|nr:hypothetical protein [Coriobacteriia bacterium]